MSARFELPAELNIYAVADTWRALNAVLPAPGAQTALAVDCAQLREIDTAGIQLLMSLNLTARQHATSLKFEAVPSILTDRLRSIGAEAEFDLPTEE